MYPASSGVADEWLDVTEAALFIHFARGGDEPGHRCTVERSREADAPHARASSAATLKDLPRGSRP